MRAGGKCSECVYYDNYIFYSDSLPCVACCHKYGTDRFGGDFYETNEKLPCPKCGEEPQFGFGEDGDIEYLKCVNADCMFDPHIKKSDFPYMMIKEWNGIVGEALKKERK
jgi:hypothetical protein